MLIGGLQFVNEETKTINWHAFKITGNTFGIFYTFPDEDGLHQHQTGKLAQAIMKEVPELLAESPVIEATDILAWK